VGGACPCAAMAGYHGQPLLSRGEGCLKKKGKGGCLGVGLTASAGPSPARADWDLPHWVLRC